MLAGQIIGSFGEISPKVLRNFKLEEPVAAIEMNMEEIYNNSAHYNRTTPVNEFLNNPQTSRNSKPV